MVQWRLFSPRGLGVITAIGVSSWYTGVLYERFKITVEEPSFPNVPGLPVFGTVRAEALTTYKADPIVSKNRPAEIMKFGYPKASNLRVFDDYILSYDTRTRVAHWVFEHLTAERLKYNEAIDRSLCNFTQDESIHKYFRATNEDYLKSGFDRGHLAAAGNHRLDQKHVEQTFQLTNIAPQVGVGFNRHSWNRLEKHVRKLTKRYINVYVCTGPLYFPRKENDGKLYVKYQVIGANHVAVPTHFFKVVVMETKDGRFHMEAYVMPNQPIDDNTSLESFQVPPDVIERSAGLLFFDQLSREKLVQINGRKTTYV